MTPQTPKLNLEERLKRADARLEQMLLRVQRLEKILYLYLEEGIIITEEFRALRAEVGKVGEEEKL